MKLAYKLWKPTLRPLEDLPKLLLLHGMGGTGALWRPIAANLEERYGILAPDQRGHGGSQETGVGAQFTPLDFAHDIIETLEDLHFYPTWILGHSMGVRSACATAFLKPERVQGLILVDLGFSGPAGGGLGDDLAHFLKILPKTFSNRAEARKFMETNCPDPAIGQYLLAVSVRLNPNLDPNANPAVPPAPETISFPFDQASLIKTIEAVRDGSVRPWVEELAKNGMPILVLRGEESLVWTHEEFQKEQRHFASFPSVVFEEFSGAGHGLPFEKRAQFVARISQFIESRTRSFPLTS